MKILVTGSNGLLGTELKKINPDLICYGKEMDVRNLSSLFIILNQEMPDIVIHCAAITNSNDVKINRAESIDTNIIGTANVAIWCTINKRRMVYISTDYVYDGTQKEAHTENEPLKPENLYAITKLGGECATKLVPNHLIIRTSFGSNNFPYEIAYDDLIVSKDYVDVIAPMILKSAISSVDGVLNIGTESKSVYEYAKKRNPQVKREYVRKTSCNFSLNINKYNKYFNNEL